MTHDLNLLTVRSFLVIAEKNGLKAAAEAIGRTESAISLQIKQLETLVGTQLFEREGRGMKLTSAGERFIAFAQRMLALQDELRSKIAEINTPTMQGEISQYPNNNPHEVAVPINL